MGFLGYSRRSRRHLDPISPLLPLATTGGSFRFVERRCSPLCERASPLRCCVTSFISEHRPRRRHGSGVRDSIIPFSTPGRLMVLTLFPAEAVAVAGDTY